MSHLHKKRIGVLRGGISPEYDVSLKTGGETLKNLSGDKYAVSDILITKDGIWHLNGVPTTAAALRDKVDVVFNALHGVYGEDGKVQRIFEELSVPYTGSGPVASAIGMNKALAKKNFKVGDEIKTPLHRVVSKKNAADNIAAEIWRSFPQPSIVKPLSGGSSIGISVARTFPELASGINKVLDSGDSAMVEEYINGREVFCGVVSDFRGEQTYVLPLLEVVGSEKMDFLDYDKKTGKESVYTAFPAQVSKEEKNLITEAVTKIYQNLSLKHYAGFDFIISKRGVYLLEVNTLPGLTETSFFPKALSSVGIPLPQFLDHVVNLAVQGK